MQTEGYKSGRPATIRCAIPCTVSRIAMSHTFLIHFKVEPTFRISYLSFSNPHQVLTQISCVRIIFKQILPIQLRFHIGGFICIAFNGMGMFLISTVCALLTRFIMGMFRNLTVGIARQSQSGPSQCPKYIQGNQKGECQQHSNQPRSSYSYSFHFPQAFAQDILHDAPSFRLNSIQCISRSSQISESAKLL